jgi:NTE family protein
MNATDVSAPSDAANTTCVLVLQGGGALGAYHIGAYEALVERGFAPDWICGISIGAINAAVIAGSPPEQRIKRLDALWHTISWPMFAPVVEVAFPWLFNTIINSEAFVFGQPNFFTPRPINPYFAPPGPEATSFYDTSPMLATLPQFVDFDLIASRAVRLSLGATEVETGDLVFFDNTTTRIGAEHVLASGSLPPGFPAMRIGERMYWDGGCVSNTPLEAVLQDQPAGHTVVFMVDLWNAAGPPPATMAEVLWRQKQIQYASRVTTHIDAVVDKVNLRHAIGLMKTEHLQGLSDPVPDAPGMRLGERLDVVHVVYRPTAGETSSSDAEFSRRSIAARRAAGKRDMLQAIDAAPWLKAEKPHGVAAVVHRVEKGKVATRTQPDLRRTTGLRGSDGAMDVGAL